MNPSDVIRNDFTKDLKTDFVAVNAAGYVIGRASTKEALERSCPDAAAYFTGADLDGAPAHADPVKTMDKALDGPFAAIVGNVDPKLMADYEKKPELVLDPDGNPPSDKAPVDAVHPAAVDTEALVTEEVQPQPKAADPLDHDKDGARGGSRPGIQSTSHKGKENRQRKPAAE